MRLRVSLIFRSMDPYSSAQNVLRCDHCEIEILHSYCDFLCQPLYIFCKPCVVDHIWAEYDEHKMVLLKQRRSNSYVRNAKHVYETRANISARIVTTHIFAPLVLHLNNTGTIKLTLLFTK